MSHDFAKSRRPAPPSPKKKKSSAGMPSWVWMLTGTLAGALVMYLVYVSGYAPSLPDLQKAQQVAATPAGKPAGKAVSEPVPDKEPPAPPKRTSPVFEFYTKLPGSGAPSVDSHALPDAQTAVPPPTTSPAAELDPIQQLLAQQEAARQQAVMPPAPDNAAAPAVPTLPATEDPAAIVKPADTKSTDAKPADAAAKTTGKYALQAGAFRKRSEADTLRAKLLMLGVPASIQQVTNAKGESLQRVIAGPFTSAADMEDARIILSGNHISTIPVK